MRSRIFLAGLMLSVLCGGCQVTIRRPAKSMSMTFSGILGQGVREVEVPLNQCKLRKGNNAVYYPATSKDLAKEVLTVLAAQEEMIRNYLEIRPGKAGAAITQKVPEPARYVIKRAPRGWSVWALELNDITELSHADEFDDLYHTLIHERTESALTGSLARGKSMYGANRGTRWIGDGLADLVAYRFSQEHSPIAALRFLAGRRQVLKEAADDWHWRSYNLWDFLATHGSMDQFKKQVSVMQRYPGLIAAQYAASLYYWASLERDKSPQTLKKIVTELRKSGRPTKTNIQNVIRKLAGQKYVDRIDTLPAAEAVTFFEAEIHQLIPKVKAGLTSRKRSVRIASYEVLDSLSSEVFPVDLSGVPTTAMVIDVMPGSPAHAGGLRRGDIVESVNSKAVEGFDAFMACCEGAGRRSLRIGVRRNGSKRLTLALASRGGCRFRKIAK